MVTCRRLRAPNRSRSGDHVLEWCIPAPQHRCESIGLCHHLIGTALNPWQAMVSLEFRLHPTTSAVRVIGHRHDNSGSSIPQSRRSQIRCHRTAGGHRLQPVLSIVFQAWIALPEHPPLGLRWRGPYCPLRSHWCDVLVTSDSCIHHYVVG